MTLHAALARTKWGSRHEQLFALTDQNDVLASAWCYDLDAVLDRRPLKVCGVGRMRLHGATPDPRCRRMLIDGIAGHYSALGAHMLLAFARPQDGDDADGFVAIPTTQLLVTVHESARHGAPMTMIRGGTDRDLPAMATMGRLRAAAYRFWLDRDVGFMEYAITRKRLSAGLGDAGARQLHFFIAEEGITAAVYVVISVSPDGWTLEECGDRDPSGARVGAILQALIAREPAERRPTIRAWLPPGFRPPQVSIQPTAGPDETMWVRAVRGTTVLPDLSGDDVLYWRSDIF